MENTKLDILQKKEVIMKEKNEEKDRYTKEKWKRIMDITQLNYANMVKRLSRKNKVSNFTLIYYSIFLIVSSLTGKYFPNQYHLVLAEYFNIILSVIILAYSLVNNNANYNIRINSIEDSMNKIKNLKRNLYESEVDDFKKLYSDITDKTERRNDRDFFITVKGLAKLYGINWFTKRKKCDGKKYKNNCDGEKEVNNYLAEINVLVEVCKNIFEYLWYIILFCIPVVVFIICIVAGKDR